MIWTYGELGTKLWSEIKSITKIFENFTVKGTDNCNGVDIDVFENDPTDTVDCSLSTRPAASTFNPNRIFPVISISSY